MRKEGEIIPRENFIEKEDIPESTPLRIIVMPNQEAVGYKDSYPDCLVDKIDKEMF